MSYPVDDEQLQHRQHSTDACPTIGITSDPRIPRCVELVVFVFYVDSVRRPWRSAELNFRFDVPWNMPCAATIKAEVMRRFDGAGVQKMTNPHLFLLNYELGWDEWFSLGDEDCLDELPEAFDPYEVYVIDQTQCQCGTCDLSWMLDGWHCPQIWHTATSGFSRSSSDSGCLSTSSLEL